MPSVAAGANVSPCESVTARPGVDVSQGDGSRVAAAVFRGEVVLVPCPSWCSTDHAAAGPRDLESVAHASDSVWLPTRAGLADMEVFVSQYPFADGGTAPVLALDATGCGEFVELTRAEARTLIAERRAKLDDFEALVDLVP
ncbi:hypothetical protein K378_01404 [Streptomyces sp. Amel2xB2]|uniref:DUF6907 domain-containing protein n=1 Tax=Streptomyces sp. Amel2xB2 TaxID=1305829 RepID=UPI000DC0284D|nr:hypothetical protein [Streptomyces sp. Amel2xB2]RAJ70239.1 hypothetical protein K378_01404 [Streptomyces sp. Amel2xB2]